MRVVRSAILLACIVSSCVTSARAAEDIVSSEPIVSTIAGDGSSGVRNGPSLTASFIEPDGIAIGPDGSIYIADGGAQEIRRIHNGVVEWVAGNSTPGVDPQQRTGGYADGAVHGAWFNRPVGVAVAKDGTVYVADLLNHCIRRIRQGMVSTFAGASAPGAADGAASAARFSFPRALAFDDDGNLYVADYGNGIREITPSGAVTTIVPNPKVYAVAARGAGKNLALAYTAADGIHFNGPSIKDVYASDRLREPDHEGFHVGEAYGITIVARDAVVITDLMHSAVRYVRFEGFPMTRALAGGSDDLRGIAGGYRDGPSSVARVYAPFALARAADGSIFLADAGNRRIRKIAGLDTRSAITDAGDAAVLSAPPGSYRIVVLGASFVFHDVLWPESIPGQIESGLIHDAATIGLRRRPHVVCVRLNGSNIFTEHSFISSYLDDGEADLVVFVGDSIMHGYDLAARPELKAGEQWRVIEPRELRAISDDLQRAKTKFLFVYVPDGTSLSEVEEAQNHLGLNGLLAPNYDVMSDRAVDQDLENMYRSSGVRMLPLVAPMVRAEAETNRVALFNTRDEHPSPEGQAWIGRTILRELERWKPWLGYP